MTQPPMSPNPYPPPMPPKSGNTGLIVGIVAGVVVLAVVAVVGFWFTARALSSDRGASPAPSSAASSKDDRPRVGDGEPATPVTIDSVEMSEPESGTGGQKCEYSAVDSPESNPDLKDVGTPGDGDKPDSGSQDMAMGTSLGELVITIDNAKAPCTAASFDHLAGRDFFDDTKCHRLTTEGIFVLQCGDPAGTGRGGPTYQYDNEYVPDDTAEDLSQGGQPEPNYPAGSVAMANSGVDTNGSQFFIVYKDTYLPPDYTVFGELTIGLELVTEVADGGAVKPG